MAVTHGDVSSRVISVRGDAEAQARDAAVRRRRAAGVRDDRDGPEQARVEELRAGGRRLMMGGERRVDSGSSPLSHLHARPCAAAHALLELQPVPAADGVRLN